MNNSNSTDFIVVMCHSSDDCKSAIIRHLPYWQQHGAPILFYSPADKPLFIPAHQNLAWGKAAHHGPASIERFRYLLDHMIHRAAGAKRLIIHEYDSLCISKEFPQTDPDKVYANAFFNRDNDPRFSEKMYCHPPLVIPITLLPKIVEAGNALGNESGGGFWDRAFGKWCDTAGVEIVSFTEHTRQGYSQNTVEPAHYGSLLTNVTAGVRVFHGVKNEIVLGMIRDNSPWILHSNDAKKRNYISFSLWGTSPKYLDGMERNIELAEKHYPGWAIRIYMPQSELGSDGFKRFAPFVKFIPDGIPPMMGRFLVHDSPDCERFIVRDADSRLSAREAAAVQEWITSGRRASSLADHPAHARLFNGGLCGFRNGAVRSMEGLIRRYLQNHAGAYTGIDHDQQFLCTLVWEEVKHSTLRHDSHTARHFPGSMPFPTKREGWRFVGEVIEINPDGSETPRAHDWPMLNDVIVAEIK